MQFWRNKKKNDDFPGSLIKQNCFLHIINVSWSLKFLQISSVLKLTPWATDMSERLQLLKLSRPCFFPKLIFRTNHISTITTFDTLEKLLFDTLNSSRFYVFLKKCQSNLALIKSYLALKVSRKTACQHLRNILQFSWQTKTVFQFSCATQCMKIW